ncbi:MAG: hypothetical protein ACI857_002482 [Arenicella sp.]|jgi:hypothetical protein
MSAYILDCKVDYPSLFEERRVIQNGEQFLSGILHPDTNSPFYPSRSDLKIMRTDSISAVITLCELLEDHKSIDRTLLNLFVASGVFIENVENHMGHLLEVFEHIKNADTEEEKLKMIYRASPPLLALQTLTNSTMSFVAQYSKVMGNNATFGNTSQSGFHAVSEAYDNALFEDSQSIALSSNTAGDYSYMVNSSLRNDISNWKESAATGAMLISSDKNKAKCEIVSCEQINIIKKGLNQNWKVNTKVALDSDVLIYSGAFNLSENEYLTETFAVHSNARSLFDDFGNLGPTNMFAASEIGIRLIKEGASKVDLFDKDIYGRESVIRLEKIK